MANCQSRERHAVASCLIMLVALLGGCATPSIKGPTSSLQKSVDLLQSTLDSAGKDTTHLRRINYAYSLKSSLVDDQQFIEFACQGVGAYADQRAALGGLHQLGVTADSLTAPASDDLSTVIGSIQQYRSKVEPLPSTSKNTELEALAQCRKTTTVDLTSIKGGGELETRALVAIPAAMAALQAFAAAVEKVILLGAQQVDIAQRAARFREFMSDPGTRTALQSILGPCAIPTTTQSATGSQDVDASDVTKQCFTAVANANAFLALSDVRMQAVIDERRRLSLLIAYNQFLALNPASVGANKSRADYLSKVGAVDESLATFDTLRGQKVASGQHLAMTTAVNNLYRISQGNLTSQEQMQQLWATAQGLSGLLQSASKDIGGVKDSAKTLEDAVRKVKTP